MHTVYLNESLFQNNDAVFTRKTLVYLAVLLLFVHIVWRRTEQFTASIFIFVQVVLYEEEKKIYTCIFHGCKSSWYILSVFVVFFFHYTLHLSLSYYLRIICLKSVIGRHAVIGRRSRASCLCGVKTNVMVFVNQNRVSLWLISRTSWYIMQEYQNTYLGSLDDPQLDLLQVVFGFVF